MESLQNFRKRAGLTQRAFGIAVYKKAKQTIAPAYAQKMGSLWETGVLLPPEDLQPIICEVLKIDPSEIFFTQTPRTTKYFINLLVSGGLEKVDAQLLNENKALQEIALKTIIKSIHRLCDEFRSFGSNLDSAS